MDMQQFKKILLIICIALCSAIFFSLSHANTTTWQPTSTVREGSTSVYTGQQHNNKETHQGIAKFRPTAQQVGKAIVRTGTVLAVDLAIQQLLNGVDYVLDPKLQKLKFPDIHSGESLHNRTGKCAVSLADNMNSVDVPVKEVPKRLAELLKKHNYDPFQVHSCSVANKYHTYLQCDTTIYAGKRTYRFQCWPYYQQKSYDEIGEQILKDADAGKPEAIDYVAVVADEWATQQEKEKQWEATRHLVASAKEKEGEGAKPNEGTPRQCPPCEPYPVGTVGYIGPKRSVYGIHGTQTGTGEEHYILYRVGQENFERGCKCYWQEDKKIAGHHYMTQPNIFMSVDLNHKIVGNTRSKFLPYP